MKKVRWFLFVAYCLFVVWYTILSRSPGVSRVEWRLLWSYREMFAGDPNWKKDVIQNLQNIAFFIPFGLFLPVKKWWVVLAIAAILSIAVETTQYIGGYGLAELDDVICNTLGAVVGFVFCACIKRIVENETST